jgi:hypothetical protein
MKTNNPKKELKNIDNKINLLNTKKRNIINQIQKECKHTRIEKSGGGIWHEWPDYGYYDVYYGCLDCKKGWTQRKIKWDEQSMLEKNIVKDTSR